VGHGPESVELVDGVLDSGLTLIGAEDPDLGHPGVHLPGQRCHGLHGQQAVPGAEHFVQELLGVTQMPCGDAVRVSTRPGSTKLCSPAAGR
jgi:hypothetical protein